METMESLIKKGKTPGQLNDEWDTPEFIDHGFTLQQYIDEWNRSKNSENSPTSVADLHP